MANEIGFSTIYPGSGLGSAGPIGATGATGANQTVRGSTGATGLNSNYITSVLVTEEGVVEFGLSDGTNVSPGILKGVTGVYAGVTAFSLGSGTSVLKGVCGGITLDFYNFRTDGLLGITYSTDGALVFTISANSGAGGISEFAENNRIVYAQSKTAIMSTDLIPEASLGTNRVEHITTSNYGYVNFGEETAGRNIVADIIESSLSVGPIERGEFTVNLSNFYTTGAEGIILDVSRATVYNLITPLGIKEFTTSNIITIPEGQIMSVTLIVHGEDIWNFPEDVVFDAESKPIFYPGVNILHMWRTSEDEVWRASFTARGIGAENIKNPGVRGSCCYFDVDGTKHCDDYVTQTYCTERDGNFEGIVPCDKNSCIVGEEKDFDGVCCTEGKCVSDIDPTLCQIIGGYFISGITCGQVGFFPETDNTDNIGKPAAVPPEPSGLCFNKCKTPTICCKNGTCLGQLTEAHCDFLGGTTVLAPNCTSANCCDHIIAPGACCIQEEGNIYRCENVDTPFACNDAVDGLNGIYMGKNTKCPIDVNLEKDICCTVQNQLTCYECNPNGSPCGCTEIITTGNSCSEVNINFYEFQNTCDTKCISKTCHRCDGTQCLQETTLCGAECSEGFELGPCIADQTCLTKPCFKTCVDNSCGTPFDFELTNGDNSCATLGAGTEFTLDKCDCIELPPEDPEFAACFWCFPIIVNSDPTVLNTDGNRSIIPPNAPPSPSNSEFAEQVAGSSQAPFRSVFSVPQSKAILLDAAAGYVENDFSILPLFNANASIIGITLPAGLNPAGYALSRDNNILYYDETNTSAFAPSFIGTAVPNNVGEVLNATVGLVTSAPSTLISTDINFRCNYVGSYKTSSNKVETRENCLKRYGYTTSEQLTNCLLCDPVNDNIPYTDLSNEVPKSVTKIEPYQDRIKAGLYAPFPPLWGRITYKYGQSTCTKALYKKNTYNLNLFKNSNIKDIVHEFLLQRGKTWLKTFLDRYDSTPIANRELQDGLAASIDSNFIGSIRNNPVSPNEFCMGGQNNPIVFTYDPYQLGGLINYGTAYVWPSPIGDGCCNNTTSSWALPEPSFDPIGPPAQGGGPPDMYYPPNNINGIQKLGERYLKKLASDTTTQIQYVRGIFGRNLRYNLDSFRTSTVFYHDDGSGTFTTTMKTDDTIKIPLAYQNGFEGPDSCAPTGGGGSVDAPLCIPQDTECEGLCGCGGGCVETSPGVCSGQQLCPKYNDSSGGDPNNWQGSGGLIAPSTVETPSLFTAQVVNKSQITSKRVYIIPGVCVDMLCPNCNSYESC
jgi:hypothetical protein